MCGVHFQEQLNHDFNGTFVFNSIKSLKEVMSCWKECGIVQVDINFIKRAKEQNTFCHKKKSIK